MGKHSENKRVTKKKNIIINLIFVMASFLVIFGFCIAIAIRGQEEESITENRALAKFPKFSFGDFFSGKFQDDLEASLSDQMLFGQAIKDNMTASKSETVSGWQTKIVANLGTDDKTENNGQSNGNNEQDGKPVEEKPKEVRNIKYIPIGGGNVCHYGDSKYMVFKSYKLSDTNKQKIDKFAKQYEKHFKETDNYFYFVNTSKAIDFNTVDETENPFLTYIKQAMPNFKCDGLKISSYEEYMNYFYETDHHWNYKGSYQGYKDVINLLSPGEEVLEPIETKTFDVYYYGSNARTVSVYTNKEKFTVYDFKFPDFTVRVNGVKWVDYGNRTMYYNKQYSTQKGYNHYGAFYGGDHAEIVFDFKQPEKENLLVIAPSYSNPINKLVASHFNKTYYIDLRHYKNQYGKKFDPESYCKKNGIDKVLVLISIDHITNGKFLLD